MEFYEKTKFKIKGIEEKERNPGQRNRKDFSVKS